MGAELHRPLQRRRGEGIVHHQQRTMLVGDLRHGFHVHDGQRGIGRRFQEQHARLRPHGFFPGGHIAAIHQGGGDAESREDFFHDMQAGPEHRLRRHDMIAGLERGQEYSRYRRHAGGGGAGYGCAFQRRHARLEHRNGGIAEAAILIAADLALEAGLGFLSRLIGIAGGEEKRLGGLLEGGAHLAGPHRQGAFSPVSGLFVRGHGFSCPAKVFACLRGLGQVP